MHRLLRPAQTLLRASARSPTVLAPLPMRPVAPCRCFSTSTRLLYKIGEISTQRYIVLSESTMDRLHDTLEELVEETGVGDVEYSSGVLTLNLGDKGTYVLNTQRPNKQIWLSSPSSGPKRYDWDDEERVWFYHRNDERLDELLERELTDSFGKTVKFDLTELES